MRRVEVALKQEPFAAILTCADRGSPSRSSPIRGFGDLFVVRVAGNVVGSSELGSPVRGGAPARPTDRRRGSRQVRRGGRGCRVADGGAMPGGRSTTSSTTSRRPCAAKNEVTPDQNLLTEAIKANAIQSRDIVLKDPLIAAEVSKGKLEVVAAYYDIDTGKFVVPQRPGTLQRSSSRGSMRGRDTRGYGGTTRSAAPDRATIIGTGLVPRAPAAD